MDTAELRREILSERKSLQEIDNRIKTSKEQGQGTGQEQCNDIFRNQTTQINLPARQNRFSKFFSQIRAKFAKQNSHNTQRDDTFTDNLQQNEYREQQNQMKQKEKKSWELEPDEKARIQKETAQIAQKHREQEEQQKQVTLQQEGYQNDQNIAQPVQQQIPPQQSSIDMGGMEL